MKGDTCQTARNGALDKIGEDVDENLKTMPDVAAPSSTASDKVRQINKIRNVGKRNIKKSIGSL